MVNAQNIHTCNLSCWGLCWPFWAIFNPFFWLWEGVWAFDASWTPLLPGFGKRLNLCNFFWGRLPSQVYLVWSMATLYVPMRHYGQFEVITLQKEGISFSVNGWNWINIVIPCRIQILPDWADYFHLCHIFGLFPWLRPHWCSLPDSPL